MEEEISLKLYVVLILKHWYWILGTALVMAVATIIITSSLPPTYEATALVAATQRSFDIELDPRFRDVIGEDSRLLQSQYRTYATLAKSNDLLQKVSQDTGWTVVRLHSNISATEGSDVSLLVLNVRGENAQEVATVANTWAETFIETVNSIYGGQRQLTQLLDQQQVLFQDLATTDADLTAFRQENGFGFTDDFIASERNRLGEEVHHRFGLIGQQLQTKNNLLTEYEEELTRLNQIRRETEFLSQTVTSDTPPAVLAALFSEMVNLGVLGEGLSQPLYQISFDTIDPVTSLQAMGQAIEFRAQAITEESETLDQEITALQAELAAKLEQLEQLKREREVKAEAYKVISLKVQETQISISDEFNAGTIQLASRAIVPTKPVSSNSVLNGLVAGLIGLMISSFTVLFVEWWRTD